MPARTKPFDAATIRRALARRESYALIERQNPTRSTRHTVGWVKVDHAVRHCTDTERFVKERGVHGDYRIISIKRRVHVRRGGEPVVDLAVPCSKPLYELEQWRGRPTARKRSAWTRLPFPIDWRKRRDVMWNEWIIKHGPLEDWAEALAYLWKHPKERCYTLLRRMNNHR